MRYGHDLPETHHDIDLPTHPYDWYELDETNGWLRMIDPSTGLDIDPQRPPSLIETVPELKGGLDFWRGNTDRVRMTNYYGRHTRASDLDVPGEFEAALASHTAFGYESYASDSRLDTQARLAASNDINAHRPPSDDFQDRLFRSIVKAGQTLSVPIDLRADGTSLERQIIALGNYWDETMTDQGEAALAAITINNLRDWMILATFGAAIRERTGSRLPAELDVGTLAGLDHFDVSRKAHSLGISTKSVLIRSETIPDTELNKPVIRVPQSGIFHGAQDMH